MFTINLEDGREAPSKASIYIFVLSVNPLHIKCGAEGLVPVKTKHLPQ